MGTDILRSKALIKRRAIMIVVIARPKEIGSKSSLTSSAKVCKGWFISIQSRSHVRSVCDFVVVVIVAVDVDGSSGGTNSAGVGAVELPAMPRQRVVDQIVDTGWIEKSTYFPQGRCCLAFHCKPQRRALSARLSCSQSWMGSSTGFSIPFHFLSCCWRRSGPFLDRRQWTAGC